MLLRTRFPGKPIAIHHNMRVQIDDRLFTFKTVKLLKYKELPKLKEKMLFVSFKPPTPILGYYRSKGGDFSRIILHTPQGKIKLEGVSVYDTEMFYIIFAGAATR